MELPEFVTKKYKEDKKDKELFMNDVKNLKDLNKHIKDTVEDMWARIFGLTLGVQCPSDRAKELFINFVTKKYEEDKKDFDYVYLDEKYCYDMITDFINYLVDRG